MRRQNSKISNTKLAKNIVGRTNINRFKDILHSYNNHECVVLVKELADRAMQQNIELRNKPKCI